jgi:hypothetical protein
MKKYFYTLLALGLITTAGNAACTGNSCVDVTITQIFIEPSGNAFIQTSGTETALNCTPAIGIYLHISQENERLFAGLLTAKTTQEPVTITVSASGSCEVTVFSI